MRYRVVFVVGLAVGYVLGSRAGRERYEQIKRLAERIADNPKVQEAAGLVGARASQVATVARDKVGDRFGDKVPFLTRNHTGTGAGTTAGATTAPKVAAPTGRGWPDETGGTR